MTDKVIPFPGRGHAAMVAEPEPVRPVCRYEIYKPDYTPLLQIEGLLNIGPDFAVIADSNNDLLMIIQSVQYSYIKNLGPVVDGGTVLVDSEVAEA